MSVKQKAFLSLLVSLMLLASPARGQDIDTAISTLSALEDKPQALAQLNQLAENNLLSSTQQVTLFMTQGDLYLDLDDLAQAFISFEQAKVIAQANQLKKAQADAEKKIGVVYYFQGQYPEALAAYQASLDYYRSAYEPIELANLYNNIALAHSQVGSHSDALKNYQLAEPLYQQYGTEIDKVDIRYNIGVLYVRMNRFDLAEKILLEVIEQRQKLKDEQGLATAYADLGVTYKHAGNYSQSLVYLLKALDYYQEQQQKYHIASQLHNISELYNYLGEPEKAYDFASQGLTISAEIGHKSAYVGCLQSLAKVSFVEGDYAKAEAYLNESSRLAAQQQYQRVIDDNKELMPLLLAAQRDPKASLATFHAHKLESSREINHRFNTQLAKFESDLLQQQIERLQQNERLVKLQQEQASRNRNYLFIAIVVALFFMFFLYERFAQRRTNRELASQVKQGTLELEQAQKQLQQQQDANSPT